MCYFSIIIFGLLSFGLRDGSYASWQENEQSRIYYDLGEEGVFRFSGNASYVHYFKLLVRDGDSLLIGSRDAVYNVSITDLSLKQMLSWPSDAVTIDTCIVKGRTEVACHNYIRVIAKIADRRLLVCGTNSFKPACTEYEIMDGSYVLIRDKSGQAICPYDPNHNNTFIYDDGALYAGTTTDFTGTDPIIYREPLQTEQYDSMTLNAPNFVSSVAHGDFVYFFLRETAVEYINCGKAVFSRVARVCKDDHGGPHRFRNRWTSFLKSRLNCSVHGEFPFYFNEIQSTSEWIEGKYGSLNTNLIYGVFTTPINSIPGSAVCAFSLQDITDTFEGNFKEQSELNANWLPVPSSKVPDPRPGQCVNDSRTLPDLTLNFIKTHSLMDEAVPSFFNRQPILIRNSNEYRFTQIAVDAQVKTAGGKPYDVLFIGTDNGKVIKAINTASASSHEVIRTIVLEEIQVFPTNASIRTMKIVRENPMDEGRLIVVSDGTIVSIPVHHCESRKITSCGECVALQDPYCAWDKTVGRCKSTISSEGPDPKFYYQSIQNGSHPACPRGRSKIASITGELSSMKTAPNSRHGKNKGQEDESPDVVMRENSNSQYSMETLMYAVITATFCALVVGFSTGYICGRKCHKDDEDNIPYPDTEYEYFEQRQNVNVRRLGGEPKLLPQDEVTYAEPVLIQPSAPMLTGTNQKTLNNSPKSTLRKQDNCSFSQFQNGENYYPQPPTARHRDHFATLRSQRDFPRTDGPIAGAGFRDGFGTTRSVKKVYL